MTRAACERASRSRSPPFRTATCCPTRPAAAQPAAQDASKQTQFLLERGPGLVRAGDEPQLEIVAANRRHEPRSGALCSRSGRARSRTSRRVHADVARLVLVLPAAAADCLDCIASQRSLIEEASGSTRLARRTPYRRQKSTQALAFDLGRYRPGSARGGRAAGHVYRLLTDLSMPHFGATALQVAPDSNLQKLR